MHNIFEKNILIFHCLFHSNRNVKFLTDFNKELDEIAIPPKFCVADAT